MLEQLEEERKKWEEVSWGEEIKGIQVRLRTSKKVYGPNEVPAFDLDLRNNAKNAIEIARSSTFCQIEVDGVSWYSCPIGNIKGDPTTIKTSEQIDQWAHIRLEGDLWQTLKDDVGLAPLRLLPGKHTIRASYPIANEDPTVQNLVAVQRAEALARFLKVQQEAVAAKAAVKSYEIQVKIERQAASSKLAIEQAQANLDKAIAEAKVKEADAEIALIDMRKKLEELNKIPLAKSVRSISNVVEFEIAMPDATSDWGEPVDGIRTRLRASANEFGPGEVPTFDLDLQIQSKTESMTIRFAPLADIEVDGVWYHAPQQELDIKGFKIGAGALYEPWVTIKLDAHMWRRSEKDWIGPASLKLTPGKHKLRVAYPTASKMRPISNAVEFAIVDPKEPG
jgi:hypothetical protein